jgi:hypothetical protein
MKLAAGTMIGIVAERIQMWQQAGLGNSLTSSYSFASKSQVNGGCCPYKPCPTVLTDRPIRRSPDCAALGTEGWFCDGTGFFD